ncbi:MAG: hypothetical protein Q4A40_04980 [Bacillota bacterium]|nr:hypothetical protein [Bacillota bacterium]
MAVKIECTIEKLKEIVDKKSPGHLTGEPYKVYTELVTSGAADKKTAGAILYFLVSGLVAQIREENSFEDISRKIQKGCSFNKKMADELTTIFLSLYSLENREEWESMELQGLEQFKSQEFTCEWEGFATWDAGPVSIDCNYEATIILMPIEPLVVDDDLARKLKKNPFMTADEIGSHYGKHLGEYLDSNFNWHCTCEEYYEPIVEDFEIDYYVKEWSEKNGFEVISCEGSGDDSGYIPSGVRRYMR